MDLAQISYATKTQLFGAKIRSIAPPKVQVYISNYSLFPRSQTYDHGSNTGVWLLCFHSKYELAQFQNALSQIWFQEFQVALSLSEVGDATLRAKAHGAVELMQNSRFRSDSVTRGRSEFSYSAKF